MKRPFAGLLIVAAASLLAEIWSNYGPFLAWGGPYHWSVTPGESPAGVGTAIQAELPLS